MHVLCVNKSFFFFYCQECAVQGNLANSPCLPKSRFGLLPPTLCNKNHNNKERTWMNLQGIASHEKSQSLKRICRLMPVIHQSRHDPIVQPGEWVAVGQVFSRRSRGVGRKQVLPERGSPSDACTDVSYLDGHEHSILPCNLWRFFKMLPLAEAAYLHGVRVGCLRNVLHELTCQVYFVKAFR